MHTLKEYPTKHLLIHILVTSLEKLDPVENSYRNILAQHYPEDRSTSPQAKHFQLSKPRISECKNFFEEDVALLKNPTQALGIAHTPLSEKEKFWLMQVKNGEQDLLNKFFEDNKRVPEYLLLK